MLIAILLPLVGQEPAQAFAVDETRGDEWSLQGAEGLMWFPQSGELMVTFGAEDYFLLFDVFLQPVQRVAAPSPLSAPPVRSCRGLSGRKISLLPTKQIEISLKDWEVEATLEFANGYAVISMRSSRVIKDAVTWLSPDGEVRRSFFECDRWDPLTQRAFLFGISAGSTITLNTPSANLTFPKMYDWRELQVPKLEQLGDLSAVVISQLPKAKMRPALAQGIYPG